MNELLEILKYTLPAVVVLLCAVFLIKSFLRDGLDKKRMEAKRKMTDEILQIRLQAYERIVLFLERISLQQLVLRIDDAGIDAGTYHRLLLQTIRDEFEHNLAQQIYISPQAWELVKAAKESVIQIINKAQNDMPKDVSAFDLASKIVELKMLEGNKQLDDSIEFVKKEVRELF